MRKCKGYYTEFDTKSMKYARIPFEEGLFHQWGIDYYDGYKDGPVSYTVAIVELPDGKVIMPIASSIQFIS